MPPTIQLGDLQVDVVRKKIKNINLSVHPPGGRVRVSAPSHLSLDSIRAFVISKRAWIKRAQQKLRAQERESPREYLIGESYLVWGQRFPLQLVERAAPPRIATQDGRLVLQVRPGTSRSQRQAIVAGWYRDQIKEALPSLIQKWEPVMGVKVAKVFVQQMKTRWGSCNTTARNIRINSELAKRPRECLEYVVVHELAHLLEASHNRKFIAVMDRFMPRWRDHRDALNQRPIGGMSFGPDDPDLAR